jgi:excisionase family DNA binding protein
MAKNLTINDLVKRWKVSDDTIRRAIEKGKLPATKIFKQWRFSEKDIVEYENKRTIKQTA